MAHCELKLLSRVPTLPVSTGNVMAGYHASIFYSCVLCLSPSLFTNPEATYKVSLQMKGYDFSLSVVPVELESGCNKGPLPPRLKLAQDELKGTSESARTTISRGTTLQELLGWLLRSRDQMSEQVKGAAPSYQEQGRLNENLEENIREVRRAKELAVGYRQRAGEVLIEAAEITGVYL